MAINRLYILITVAACFISNYVNAAVVTGPDANGYIAETLGYNLRDIQSTGTILPGGDDESYRLSTGFDFTFNGSTMNSIDASINGTLSNSGAGNNFHIMGYSDDLNSYDSPTSGDIYYQTIGDIGAREFIVGYYGVSHYPCCASEPPVKMTFEMILHEGTNNIEFQYAELFDQDAWDAFGGLGTGDARHGEIGLRYFPYVDGNNLSISDAVGYHEYTGYLISQVPIPAAVWLFGSGLIGLVGLARRKS